MISIVIASTVTDPPSSKENVKTRAKTKENTAKSSIEEQLLALSGRSTKDPPKYYKSVQTAFSSIDLTTDNKECRFCNGTSRKTKSHQDLRKQMHQNQIQDEILEWLQEIYNINKTKLWEEKLEKLAEKLMKPGAEERLKTKIRKYLKRVPSEFSDCDEEGKAFREELPDTIIKKLKKLYMTNKSHDIKLYRVEVPNYLDYSDRDKKDKSIKNIVKCWLKSLPIKKRDFLGRAIKREDILSSIVQRLEPFIQHRPNCEKDYKCMLRSYIKQIIIEMPIDVTGNNKGDYLSQAVDNLVDSILYLDEETKEKNSVTDKKLSQREDLPDSGDSPNQNDITKELNQLTAKELKDLKDFVAEEITYFLEKTDSVISRKRLAYIKMEITGILMDTYKYIDSEFYDMEDVKEELILVLLNIGKFSEVHSESFANTLLRNFKNKFRNVEISNNRPHRLGAKTFSETYMVYYNSTKRNLIRNSTNSFPDYETERKDNIQEYTDLLSETIDKWLAKFEMQIPLVHKQSLRDIAVSDLIRNIVDRHKYLEQNPTKRVSDHLETDRLKCYIFKWIRTLVGEDTTETIEHVPELLRKIQRIPVPVFTMAPGCRNIQSLAFRVAPKKAVTRTPEDMDYIEQLFEEILEWIESTPQEVFNFSKKKYKKIKYVRELAENIHKAITEGYDPDDIIDDEVDEWIKIVWKGKLRIYKIEELKERLLSITFEEGNKNDVAMQTAISIDSKKSIDESEGTTSNDENYILRNVTKQVDEWLVELVPNIPNNSSRKSAMTNLVEDIVDRHKYQEVNPSCRGTDGDEVEHLKYQIFKWLYKIFGDDILQIVDHASELMLRLRTIFAPRMKTDYNLSDSVKTNGVLKSSFKKGSTQKPIFNSNLYNKNVKAGRNNVKFDDQFEETPYERKTTTGYGRHKSDFGLRTRRSNDAVMIEDDDEDDTDFSRNASKYKQLSNNRKSNNRPSDEMLRRNFSEFYTGGPYQISTPLINAFNENEPGQSMARTIGPPGSKTGLLVQSRTEVYQVPSVNQTGPRGSKERKKPLEIKQEPREINEAENNSLTGMDLKETYQHFDKILRDSCEQLPLDSSTPEQRKLAEIARNGVYNGIWKTYFTLKSDPNTEYDYQLFERVMEERIDLILDCLPQTPEFKSMRAGWKAKVILNFIRMLRYVQSITSKPTFKQKLTEKVNRAFLKGYNKKLNDQVQHIFVMNAADAYILNSIFKTDDPIKANIYRQRLLKRLEELAEHVKTVRKVEFRNVDKGKLLEEALKLLESVPLPNDETLRDEADEVLICEEIEQWYCELPVKPIRSVLDDMMRNRMREILAKKIHDMEKRIDQDESAYERDVRHEVSLFLEKKAELQENEQFNINFMVDQLTYRLKNRKAKLESYKTFEKGHPGSSTFAQPNNEDVLAKLVDPHHSNYVDANVQIPSEQERPQTSKYPSVHPRAVYDPGSWETSQVAGPSGVTDYQFRPQRQPIGGADDYQRPQVSGGIDNHQFGQQPSGGTDNYQFRQQTSVGTGNIQDIRSQENQNVNVNQGRQNYEPGYPSGSEPEMAANESPSEEFGNCQGFLNPSQPCGKIFASAAVGGPEERGTGTDDEDMLRCSCLERLLKFRSRRHYSGRNHMYPYHMMFPFGFPL